MKPSLRSRLLHYYTLLPHRLTACIGHDQQVAPGGKAAKGYLEGAVGRCAGRCSADRCSQGIGKHHGHTIGAVEEAERDAILGGVREEGDLYTVRPVLDGKGTLG